MNAYTRELLERLERETAEIDFPLPLPPFPVYCTCEQPIPTNTRTPDGVVCDCGGLIIVDCDEVSK